jgi:methylmalonyl-CoA carboxyltransferase 12S subunit
MSTVETSSETPAETSAESPVEQTVAELLETVRVLTERVAHLEAALQEQEAAGIPEEVVVAISAAVAAFLGHRAKITQLHYRTGAAYAQQGRAVVQGRHGTHLSR